MRDKKTYVIGKYLSKSRNNGIVRESKNYKAMTQARISIYIVLIMALAAVNHSVSSVHAPGGWQPSGRRRRLMNMDGACCIDLTSMGTGKIKAPNIKHRTSGVSI